MTPQERAETLAVSLAEAYEDIAAEFTRAAWRLRHAPVSHLVPVPYLHRSTRALEDALDAALVAL